MKYAKIIILILTAMLLISCSTAIRDPAAANCDPNGMTNAGTHFDDYERCNDL